LNKAKIVGLSILLLTLFSTNCFATTTDLKVHKINKIVAIEDAEQYRENIKSEITIGNVKYQLQDVSEQENKGIVSREKEQVKQKIVYTNNKYEALNMFESKIEVVENEMQGTLELQNNSLDIKVNYMHSDIKALERMEIIRNLRLRRIRRLSRY